MSSRIGGHQSVPISRGRLLSTRSQYISLDRLLSKSNNFLIIHHNIYRQYIYAERFQQFETRMHEVTLTWLHDGLARLRQGVFQSNSTSLVRCVCTALFSWKNRSRNAEIRGPIRGSGDDRRLFNNSEFLNSCGTADPIFGLF
jgi:hypothetical protein